MTQPEDVVALEADFVASETTPAQSQPEFLREAFEKFKALIRPNDDQLFRETTLEDVRTAARIIERDQRQRNCLRHLKRIEPLLDALRKLGVLLEPLCQGVPYLCYIWAPLKLLLQIADEYTKGFEQLLDAYAQIAQSMPRLDRLSSAFKDESGFQPVLANMYSDILEFHGCAYRFLRRSGWKHLFDSSWKSFEARFNTILQRLAHGRDLIDKEAASFDMLQAKSFRDKLIAEADSQEDARRDWRVRDCISWLDLKGQDLEQQELLERRVATREPNTCEWLLGHTKILTWLDEDDPRRFLWLRGKPGSGKTTLASYLIERGFFPPKASIFYCLCTYGFAKTEKNACNLAFRSILAQVIRQKADVVDHIYDNYVKPLSLPSGVKVRQALKEVLDAIGSTFLIVDGLDECEPAHQKQLLSELMQMMEPDGDLRKGNRALQLKVLICSRESKEITQRLRGKPVLSLREEKDHISKDINLITRKSLQSLGSRFRKSLVEQVADEIVERADGMFLWVHLVVGTLLECESEHDLRQTLKHLPTKLPDVYRSIMDRLDHEADQQKICRVNHILGCLTFALRPLKVWEVCDFVVLHECKNSVTKQTQLGTAALDICKPIVEEQEGQVISLVHFSAREFLIHAYSGPRLVESQVQGNLTAACLRYLLSCKYFNQDRVSSEQYGELVLGLDNLFPYVYEHWPDHLQKYCDSGSSSTSGVVLNQEITVLLLQLSQRIAKATDHDERTSSGQKMAVSSLAMPPAIKNLISYRQEASKVQRSAKNHDSEVWSDSTKDPTSLSVTYRRFQKAFESLLDGSCPFTPHEMGVEDEELCQFQKRHKGSMFLCKYQGCVRASIGFSTSIERTIHEKSHRPQFYCNEPACAGADGIFTSRESLKRHIKQYHPNLEQTWPTFPTSDVVQPVFEINHRQKFDKDEANKVLEKEWLETVLLEQRLLEQKQLEEERAAKKALTDELSRHLLRDDLCRLPLGNVSQVVQWH